MLRSSITLAPRWRILFLYLSTYNIFFLLTVLQAKKWQQSNLSEELLEWTHELYHEFKVTFDPFVFEIVINGIKLSLIFKILFESVVIYLNLLRISQKLLK